MALKIDEDFAIYLGEEWSTEGEYVCAKLLLLGLTLCNPMTVSHQVLLSMGFSRQEYWSGLPCSPPGDLPDLGIEPTSPAAPALQAGSLRLSHQRSPRVNGTPPNSCPSGTCEWNLIWRQGLCRCSQVRMRPSCLALIPIRLMSL